MHSHLRKLTAVIAALTGSIGLAGAATITTSGAPAGAASNVTVNRLAGDNRYETSRIIAEKKYPNGVQSGNVVLATGHDFPDALAGNYLAGQLQAPVLLTTPSTSAAAYSASVVPALAALLPGPTKKVTLLGGGNAIGTDVENDLKNRGYTVVRIAGPNRYDTASAVDSQQGQTAANGISGNPTALIATGQNFPDALSAGPLAWSKHFPVILTDGTQSTLSPQAKSALTANKIKNALVMGGSAAVSDGIVADLKANGITIDKQFAGADRTDTADQFLDYIIANYGFGNAEVILTSGAFFADALSGGALGGDPKGIQPTEPDKTLGPFNTAELKKLQPPTLTILGGSFAYPVDTATAAQDAATTSCSTARTSLPEFLCASIVSTTSDTQANSTNGPGTVVEFDMSQDMSSATFDPTRFKVWPADDLAQQTLNNGSSHNGFTGVAVCGVTVNNDPNQNLNCPKSPNSKGVRVLFNSTPLRGSSGADNATTLTLATMVTGAVSLTSGAANPAGSASIGVPGQSTPPAANTTSAPDVRSIGSIRQASLAIGGCGSGTPGCSAIDVGFDKPATPTANAHFALVFAHDVDNGQPPSNTNRQEDCVAPSPAQASSSATTTPSFNTANSTVTIVCRNPSGQQAPRLDQSPAEISYILVFSGSVETSGGTVANYLGATSSPAQQLTSPLPALLNVTLQTGANGGLDQTTFNFDTNIPFDVASMVPNDFSAALQNGTSVDYAVRTVTDGTLTTASKTVTSSTAHFTAADVGSAISDDDSEIPAGTTIASVESSTSATMTNAATVTDAQDSAHATLTIVTLHCSSAPLIAPTQCQTTSNGSSTSVVFASPNGSLAAAGVVGGIAAEGAVLSSANNGQNSTQALHNPDAEVGAIPVTNSSTGQTPGVINAPQLKSGSVSNGTATDTFDEAVTSAADAAGNTAGRMHWFDSDGTELTCASNGVTFPGGSNSALVNCTHIVQGGSSSGPTDATSAQLGAIVSAMVDFDAVTGNTGASSNAASTPFENPEGNVAA